VTHASTRKINSDRAKAQSYLCLGKLECGVALQSTMKGLAVAALPACFAFIGTFRAVDDALIGTMVAGIVFVLVASFTLSGQSRSVRP
jgi:hypothetical protein